MSDWTTPVSEKILDVVRDALTGEVVIPEFQRSFIWTKKQVQELLISVLSGYFIGNFLALDSVGDKRPLPSRLIEGVEKLNPSAATAKHPKVRYILDGQQRLTALFYCVHAPQIPLKGVKTACQFFIDVERLLTRKKDEPIPEDSVIAIPIIPAQGLNQAEKYVQEGRYISFKLLADQPSALEWLWSKQTYLKTDENKRILMSYITTVHEYPIPIIPLDQKIGLDAIVDTFERINRTGTRLSTFDLLVALLYPKIKLRDLWDHFEEDASITLGMKADEIPNVIDPEYLAKIISLVRGKSCKKADILNLKSNDFEKDWDRVKAILLEAMKRLQTVYGVIDLKRHVPYYAMVVPLAALLLKIDELGKTKLLYDKLDKWYWAAVFSERYESSADTYASGDYTDVSAWLSDNKAPSWIEKVSGDLKPDSLDSEDTRSAIYRGVMCVIALTGAKDFNSGQPVKSLNCFQDDHVFPKSKFKNHQKVNSVLNRTLLDKTTNSLQIKGAQKPSEYLPLFTKALGSEATMKTVLQTHLIDADGYNAMKSDDLDTFIETRQTAVLEAIKKTLK